MLSLTSSVAGVHVTPEVAMQVDAVWACIDVISAALASSDWNVYAGARGADKKEALPDDTLQYVLNVRPNSDMTAQACKRALMIAAVGYGNGYAEIERDMAGRIIGLWPIPPDRVEPRRDTETGRLFYRVYPAGAGAEGVDLESWEVFHIRGAGLTGAVGDHVINRAVQSIAHAVAIDQFGSAYFGNNTQLGTIFIRKQGKMSDQQKADFLNSVNSKSQGAKKAFTTGLLEGGEWDVKQLGTDADKAQLIEAKQLSVESICRWFRVPPHKIAHLLRATNNNIEHQGLEFSRDTLRPWVKEIEQESDYKLIPSRGARKFIELDVDWAEQGDYKSRAEAYQILRAMGAFSANDVLRKLGENTIGPVGDIRIVQGANVRLEDVGAAFNTEAAPEPADDDEVVQAWVQSVFQRLRRRFDNRLADLERAGHEDASRQARRDAFDAAAPAVAEVADVLEVRWPGAMTWAEAIALRVATGMDPVLAAQALMNTLKGTR